MKKYRGGTRAREDSSSVSVIDLDSDSSDDYTLSFFAGKGSKSLHGGGECVSLKKKLNGDRVAPPPGFHDPLSPGESAAACNEGSLEHNENGSARRNEIVKDRSNNKKFWKAGDFDGAVGSKWETPPGAMDHVRVHPRFLHSNATSHKWVLGAFAELLDNSLDEVCNGATYVNIDMILNKKDQNRMLLIEDNGGGMDPDEMRQCMSLGYSLKSKVANTIGQYGNGFKTSTMRLGADVILFSRSAGKDGKRSTQSIGLLSYTFLRSTGKEDIVVPMLDYERAGDEWKMMIRSSVGDWSMNVETMVKWSPFSSEAELLTQFDRMKDQGTRMIIYNLWENDEGQLELDFDADQHDIQIRGVNRDEKSIQMAHQYPNSWHFLTYRHSLRSYASILYLTIPPGFRMILRGKDVEHHNVVNDMMMTKEVTYRPHPGSEGVPKETNMVAIVTVGFVKDAKAHIDVQGFNVYHKNRLIKPFWKLWNAAGSDGRGIIGVLQADFVEPAHDKQGFERTIVLSRLETKLKQMQKRYWDSYCHKIGYASRRSKNRLDEGDPDYSPDTPSKSKNKSAAPRCSERLSGRKTSTQSGMRPSSSEPSFPMEDVNDDELQTPLPQTNASGSFQKTVSVNKSLMKDTEAELNGSLGGRLMSTQLTVNEASGNQSTPSNGDTPSLDQLVEENRELKERLKRREEEVIGELLQDLDSQRDQCKLLESQLLEANQRYEELNKEQNFLKKKLKVEVIAKLLDFVECPDATTETVLSDKAKVEVIAKLLDFVECPDATTETVLSDKAKEGKKRKATPTISRSTSSAEVATGSPAKKLNTSQSGLKKPKTSFKMEEDVVEVVEVSDEEDTEIKKESKKKQESPIKNVSPAKKQLSKTPDQGKGKIIKAKPEPTNEEMHVQVTTILKQVDFHITTLSDVLRQLGAHFGVDLMHRKAEVRAIIRDVLNDMSDDKSRKEEEEKGYSLTESAEDEKENEDDDD